MTMIRQLTLIALGALFWVGASTTTVNGQTITWTAASNPHVVSGTYVIPAGQTLVMEAGVIVNMQASSILQVDGQLIGNGTAANHIRINGAPGAQTTVNVRGTFDLKFTEIRVLIAPDSNGVLLFADSTFFSDGGGGYIFSGSIQADNSRAPYLQLDRCAFVGDTTNYHSASLYLAYATVVLRNTTFTNGSFCSVYPGYLFVDGVSSDHSGQFGLALGSDSDLFLNNISVTNAVNAGLQLAGDTRNGTNVLIGPNVTLQNNDYPVHLTVAGLHAGSVIPATGNRKNLIHVSETAGNGGYWPRFSIPYYVDGSPLTVGNGLRILPGVTVKMAPFSYINDIGFGDGMRAFGTKIAPITFERADPAQSWYDIHADRTEGGRLRHTIVRGNTDGVNGGRWRLENCVFQNNGIGTNGGALVSGSQYLNNTMGAYGTDNLNDAANPNSFQGNGTGLYYSPDARNCWWNSPSGPTTPSNPGGTGDSIGTQQTVFAPFRTSAPSYADAPPEVVLMRPAFQQDPGSKVTLRWTSTDDVGIASHKILFSPVGNWPGSFQTVATLPGNQFTYEWTAPNIGNTINGSDAFIKVVAVDTTGKESFDEAEIIIPTNAIAGDVHFNVTPGQTFGPGEMIPLVFTTTGIDPYLSQVEFYLEDIRGETRKLTGRGLGGLPFLSTDTARFVVAFGNTTNNRKYWYSPLFKIRPDSHLNDAPPTVSLTFPQAGNSFAPGSVIPISWTASDDEGLRGFDIVASYNAGRTWQPIAQNLPGTTRSFDWQTAPGSGYGDVRMMVIAKDWRFQTSSDGAARSFAIVNGVPTPTPSATPTPAPTATPVATPTPTPTLPPMVNTSGNVSYCSSPTSNPLAGATMTLTGTMGGSTLTSGSGAYTFTSLPSGGNYTVTPAKAPRLPGSTGINTVDVVAVQKHFLVIGTPLSGCHLAAANVNGSGGVNTVDVIAIQKFFLVIPGTASVGQYQFTPTFRTYTGLVSAQAAQDFDAVIFGDVMGPFADRAGVPSQDAAGDDLLSYAEVPSTVATVTLPEVAVDQSKSNFIAAVTTSAIDAKNKLVGFQGDFTFDERVVTFQSEPVQKAGITGGAWNVAGNILPGPGPIRTLRLSAYSLDFTPLSGSGTLFELRMRTVSNSALRIPHSAFPLLWAAGPDQFIFIDADLSTQKPGNAAPGSVTQWRKLAGQNNGTGIGLVEVYDRGATP